MLVNYSVQSRNRCFLWVSPSEVIVEAMEHDAVSTKRRRGDYEDWETAVVEVVVVVLGVVAVGYNTTTTKERVHNHDAEHHVTEVRSVVGQSEDVDNCPSVDGVVPPRGGEGWDIHH